MNLFFAAVPIAFLIFVMTKMNGLPPTIAFALAALLTYLVRISYCKTSPNLAHAAVVNGLLQALTPISIVFGAILFFVALERSGAMGGIVGLLTTIFLARSGIGLAKKEASAAVVVAPNSRTASQ